VYLSPNYERKKLNRDAWKSRAVVFAVLVLVALAVLFLRAEPEPAASGRERATEQAKSTLPTGAEGTAAPGGSQRRTGRPLGRDPLVADNKHSQIKAIEKLIGYLMKNYPDDWQQRVQALLAQAFPGLADQLFAQYQNMTAYNDWLKANREQLAAMTPGEKRDAMREARFRFFGADAAEIWEESIRHERIYDAMDSISEATDTSVDQKLKTYLDAIHETYGEKAPDFLEKRQTELTTNFLKLPSVQNNLREMTADARQQQLRQIRRAMGMDDEALARWSELDGQRDQAWETGERYMQQRDEITRSTQGDEQARRLEALRNSTFGGEADIIAEEESAGFFRFGHDRVYGKE
jgi:hypothetical protein